MLCYKDHDKIESLPELIKSFNYLKDENLLVYPDALSTNRYPINKKEYFISESKTLWFNKHDGEGFSYNHTNSNKHQMKLDPRMVCSRLETLLEIKQTFDSYKDEGHWFYNALGLKSPNQMQLSKKAQHLLRHLPYIPD